MYAYFLKIPNCNIIGIRYIPTYNIVLDNISSAQTEISIENVEGLAIDDYVVIYRNLDSKDGPLVPLYIGVISQIGKGSVTANQLLDTFWSEHVVASYSGSDLTEFFRTLRWNSVPEREYFNSDGNLQYTITVAPNPTGVAFTKAYDGFTIEQFQTFFKDYSTVYRNYIDFLPITKTNTGNMLNIRFNITNDRYNIYDTFGFVSVQTFDVVDNKTQYSRAYILDANTLTTLGTFYLGDDGKVFENASPGAPPPNTVHNKRLGTVYNLKNSTDVTTNLDIARSLLENQEPYSHNIELVIAENELFDIHSMKMGSYIDFTYKDKQYPSVLTKKQITSENFIVITLGNVRLSFDSAIKGK